MKPRYEFMDDGRFDPARVGQSLLATLGGWAAGALVSGFGIYSPIAFVYMAPFVLPTWLLFVLPHALLLPRGHVLTRPSVAWLYGAFWGGLVLVLYHLLEIRTFVQADQLLTNGFYVAAAAVTGAVTGLIAASFERKRR
jgi:hypothetical protein